MKNTLAENMLRFGTKNLTTAVKQRLMEEVKDPLLLKAMPDIKLAEKFFAQKFNENNPGTGLVYYGTHFVYKVSRTRTPQEITNNAPYMISAFGIVTAQISGASLKDTTPNIPNLPILAGANAIQYIGLVCDNTMRQDSSSVNSNSLNNNGLFPAGGMNPAAVNASFGWYKPEMLATLAKTPAIMKLAATTKSNPLYSKFYPMLNGQAKIFYDLLPGQTNPTVQKPPVPVKKP